jgi:hypothetical protein
MICRFTGGNSPGPNSTRVPDYVHESVAGWIERETIAMDEAWGPGESRGALAFVHIPPYDVSRSQDAIVNSRDITCRHAIQAVQSSLDSERNPGLNGSSAISSHWRRLLTRFAADELGIGSTQATVDPFDTGADQPFWDALNLHVKNLHAIISGHGKSRRGADVYTISTFHVKIMETNGAHENRRRMSYFVSINIQGAFSFAQTATSRRSSNEALCRYGGYTGHGWGHGVRNILFQSPDPSVGLITWIRLEDGETRANVTLDRNFR